MKIQPKLILAFAVIALLVAMTGYLSFNNLKTVGTSFDIVHNETTPTTIALNSMKGSTLFLIFEVNEISVEASKEHLEAFVQAKEELVTATQTYKQLARDQEVAGSIDKRVKDITAFAEEIMELKEGEASKEVLIQKAKEFNEEAEGLSSLINSRLYIHKKALEESQSNVDKEIQTAAQINLVFTLIAFSLALSLGVLISRSIYKPVIKLKKAVNEITKGNLDSAIEVSSADEIGELASQFDIMRLSVKETNKNLNQLVRMRTNELEKVNEELIQKDKLKNEFINIASHELRTPVQPIVNFVDLAMKGYITHEEAFDKIAKNAFRLQQLANDILDVSRIESGQLTYTMLKVSINDLIRDVVNTMKVDPNGDVSVITKLDNDVQIDADPYRLTQVLTNIVGNAIKFTKRGTIMVESHVLADKNKIEIRISDTGGGIPEDILPNLFGKFVTKSIDGNIMRGTGLGLYISKAIVTAHAGEIFAYNNNEGGATLEIVLPTTNSKIIQDAELFSFNP